MTLKQRLSVGPREIKSALEGLVALAFIFVTTPFSLHAQTPNLSFASAVTYSSKGNFAKSAAVADVNGDGKLDLVVANQCTTGTEGSGCTNYTGLLGVLLGNGDGTFQAAVTYSSGSYDATSVAVADVNGDGKPDLVVTNVCSNSNCNPAGTPTVDVLLGNGNGTFQTAVTYSLTGYTPLSVVVADVNGDGKPDLVVAIYCASISNCNPVGPGAVSVLLGNGDGTFQAAVPYGSGGNGAQSVAVADVNGDGKPDVLAANFSGTVGVLLGNGNGTFQTAVTYNSAGSASSVAVADVNGDGKPDLAVVANGLVAVLLGNGDGTFQGPATYPSGGYQAQSVAVADVNGDGKPDLVVANDSVSSTNGNVAVGVLLGNGDGIFQAPVTFVSAGFSGDSVTAADVNGDGKPDVLLLNYSCSSTCTNSTASVFINTSVGPTTTTVVSSLNPSGFGQAVTLTATVRTQGFKGMPTGTVSFMDGTTTLGMGTLNGSGVATYSTSALAVGSHSITAVYGGDANNAGSTSSVLTETVNAAPATTTTTLLSSANPAASGASVTFTATVMEVAPGTGVPTGTVMFKDGATTMGTGTLNGSGMATYSTTSLSVGSHSITAIYGGDANNAGSSSSVLAQTVNASDFALSSNPTTSTVSAGGSATFTVTLTPQGSFTNPISLSCSGLPALAGCAFNPSTVTPNANTTSSTLTITTGARTAFLAPPSLGWRSIPLYPVAILLLSMLFGTVRLSASNRRKVLSYVPLGLLVCGCMLIASCAIGGGGGTGGSGGTPAGTYTVTVTGVAGTDQHTTTVTLTVQ